MPICIECRYPVSQLYHSLHSRKPPPPPIPPNPSHKSSTPNLATPSSAAPKANPYTPRAPAGEATRAASGSGGDVRLTQCPRCKRFADKYVEHDFVVLFIDLVLVKPQVYRHLLFNRLSREDDELDPSILRLGTLLLLFDVYLTWSHIESLPSHQSSASPIPHLPILLQYAFYLFLCAAATLSQHLTIRWLAGLWGLGGPATSDDGDDGIPNVASNIAVGNGTGGGGREPPKKPTPNAISTALFVSSCMSLFPILMVVWKYDDASPSPASPSSSIGYTSGFLSPGKGINWVRRGVSWAVVVQNLEAMRILLGCGYLSAGALVVVGGAVRWFVRMAVLEIAGLGEGS